MPVAVTVAIQIMQALMPFAMQALAAIEALTQQANVDHAQVAADLATAAAKCASAIGGIPARLAANDAKIDAEIAGK